MWALDIYPKFQSKKYWTTILSPKNVKFTFLSFVSFTVRNIWRQILFIENYELL